MTVVFAQTANAFACRSATRWPGALGWTTNRLLVRRRRRVLFSFVVLFVDPIADELGQAIPPLAGWMVALASPVVLLAVDALDKRWRRRAPTVPRPSRRMTRRRHVWTAPYEDHHGTSDPMPARFPTARLEEC